MALKSARSAERSGAEFGEVCGTSFATGCAVLSEEACPLIQIRVRVEEISPARSGVTARVLRSRCSSWHFMSRLSFPPGSR